MHELTLEWTESGQCKQHTLREPQPGSPPLIHLGRDPARCQVVFHHPTVSGLHVGIGFDPEDHQFFLQNLRDSNPPLVNGQRVGTTAIPLQSGSRIQLGDLEVQVAVITFTPTPPPATLLLNPGVDTPAADIPEPTYGLRCSHCQKVSSYDRLDLGCPWCGASLATASSILILPNASP